jgi:hypothetical protein
MTTSMLNLGGEVTVGVGLCYQLTGGKQFIDTAPLSRSRQINPCSTATKPSSHNWIKGVNLSQSALLSRLLVVR